MEKYSTHAERITWKKQARVILSKRLVLDLPFANDPSLPEAWVRTAQARNPNGLVVSGWASTGPYRGLAGDPARTDRGRTLPRSVLRPTALHQRHSLRRTDLQASACRPILTTNPSSAAMTTGARHAVRTQLSSRRAHDATDRRLGDCRCVR